VNYCSCNSINFEVAIKEQFIIIIKVMCDPPIHFGKPLGSCRLLYGHDHKVLVVGQPGYSPSPTWTENARRVPRRVPFGAETCGGGRELSGSLRSTRAPEYDSVDVTGVTAVVHATT